MLKFERAYKSKCVQFRHVEVVGYSNATFLLQGCKTFLISRQHRYMHSDKKRGLKKCDKRKFYLGVKSWL